MAYLLGSVSTGLLVSRWRGINLRGMGSGNIGATNVTRVIGKTEGIATLLGDTSKGVVPVLVARSFGADPLTVSLIGLFSVLGHLWPVFFRFHGGKGVATAFGVLIGMTPGAVIATIAVFLVIFIASRMVSLASIITATVAPVILWTQGYAGIYVMTMSALAILIVAKHTDNIRRIIKGTEPKFRFRAC